MAEREAEESVRDFSSIGEVRAGSIQPSEPLLPIEDFEEEEDEDDDYGAPMSVGPVRHATTCLGFGELNPFSPAQPEEMLPDETDEQFEERIRQRRTNILLKFMGTRLEEEGQLLFTNLVKNNRRKTGLFAKTMKECLSLVFIQSAIP